MVRFIVQKQTADFYTDENRKDFYTLDVEIPELERMLTSGGRGEMGFESWQLIGAVIIEDKPNEK